MATTTLTGTTGNDILNAPGSVTTLVAGLQGNDTITLTHQSDEAQGGAGGDSITLAGTSTVNNTVAAGSGDDTIFVNTAASTIGGSIGLNDGADLFNNTSVQIVSGSVGGNAGADTITLLAGVLNSNVGGGKNADDMNFSAGTLTNATINGGEGKDTLSLNGGTQSLSTIQAGAGHDVVLASAASMTNGLIGGGKGFDSIVVGTQTTLTVSGGAGNDTITLATGANGFGGGIIYGDGLGVTAEGANAGNDLIGSTAAAFGTAGATTIYGAGGNDTISFLSGTTATTFIVDGGVGNDVLGGTAASLGFSASSLIGGAGADTISLLNAATAGSSVILGGDGADSISLVTGNALNSTSINGGAGHDTIRMITNLAAQAGLLTAMTTINGGSGDDVIIFDTVSAGIRVGTAVMSNITGLGSMYQGMVTYDAGDKVVLNNTALSTTGANWAGAGGQIMIISTVTALGTTGSFSNNSQASVAVYADTTNTYFFISSVAGVECAAFAFVVNSDLVSTTSVGLVNANTTNFNFTVAANNGTSGAAGSNGVAITFV